MSASSAIARTSLSEKIVMPHGWFGDLAVLAFVIAQYLDGALTYLGLHTWGIAIEANPLVSTAVSFAGFGTGLAATKLFAVSLGIMLHLKRAHVVVALLAALHFAVAVLPWTLLFLTLR